jgi:hypothetical protein
MNGIRIYPVMLAGAMALVSPVEMFSGGKPHEEVDSVAGVITREPVDTAMTGVTLGEITVKASRVIRKSDMDVLIPSKSAVEASPNGMSLLNNLMIPSLSVNEFMGTVRTFGQDVQIRINGRKASADQLRTLDPTSVKRVEWMDDPGLKYGDAVAVINVVVSNPLAGGSVMAQGMQSFNQPWGNGYLDLKLNNGRSQWGLGVQGRYTNRVESHREYTETFTRADGVSVTRTESPMDGYVSMTNLLPRLSYSYINSDKTVVWVGLTMDKNWPTVRSNTGLMLIDGSDEKIVLHERQSDDEGFRPGLNAYWEQKLPHNQTLALDVSGSVFNGRSSHEYRESLLDDMAVPVTDVNTYIRDRQYSVNVEGSYVKRWHAGRFTGGVHYGRTHNRAVRESGSVSRHSQERTYVYGEYFHMLGKVNVTGGLGAQGVALSSDGGGMQWSLRPRLSVGYRLNDISRFSFNLSSRTSAPSLSQTDGQIQQIDGFQYQIGNPDLKSYNSYQLKLQYKFNLPRVSGRLEGEWNRAPHAIAPYLQWDGDRLITSYENSGGHTMKQVSLSAQVEILPDVLTLKGSIRYYNARTRGTGYVHRFHNWCGDVSLNGFYRNFILTVSYEDNPSTLWGEVISHNEKTSTASIGYRWRGLTAMVGMFMPFTRYSMGSESLNRYNSNRNVLRSRGFDRMPVLQISYNFNWGKQKKDVNKLTGGDADGETLRSKAAGR